MSFEINYNIRMVHKIKFLILNKKKYENVIIIIRIKNK